MAKQLKTTPRQEITTNHIIVAALRYVQARKAKETYRWRRGDSTMLSIVALICACLYHENKGGTSNKKSSKSLHKLARKYFTVIKQSKKYNKTLTYKGQNCTIWDHSLGYTTLGMQTLRAYRILTMPHGGTEVSWRTIREDLVEALNSVTVEPEPEPEPKPEPKPETLGMKVDKIIKKAELKPEPKPTPKTETKIVSPLKVTIVHWLWVRGQEIDVSALPESVLAAMVAMEGTSDVFYTRKLQISVRKDFKSYEGLNPLQKEQVRNLVAKNKEHLDALLSGLA